MRLMKKPEARHHLGMRMLKNGGDMPQLYMKAIQGDKKALKQITAHLKDDLQATAKLYQKLKPILQV